jgi:beta-ureidopropionase
MRPIAEQPMKVPCALIQMGFTEDVDRNVGRAAELIGKAGEEGAKIVALSELATSIYFCYEMNRDYFDLAETVPGPSTERISAAAAEADCYVIFPLYERAKDGQLYNSAAFIDRRGEIVGVYRKNLIPIMKFEGVEGVEKFYFRPGNLGYPVFDTDLGVKVGITICYERHFPEGPRSLALAGADVIFVPTATPAGQHVWDLELRAMAVANLLWVAGINRLGPDQGGSDMEFFGSSLVSAPNGEIAAQASADQEEILHAEIDTALSATLREGWGFFRDRRPEIYGAISDG